MTPSEAAKYIGCSPQHVRTLIRTKKIRAKRHKIIGGFCYEVSLAEANRYRRLAFTNGWPRGQERKKKGRKT